ncbi:MAG: hypothetical protein RMM58_05805 [Chloroflexota bacterium]|nr:hypothetical protein [Dehalococcoidia bacterium]MDW8253376.1 hypothetical protein [Chloroflexota bacterium]
MTVTRYHPPAPNPDIVERLRRDAELLWGSDAARALDDLIVEAAAELTVVAAATIDPTVDWPDLEPPWTT